MPVDLDKDKSGGGGGLETGLSFCFLENLAVVRLVVLVVAHAVDTSMC